MQIQFPIFPYRKACKVKTIKDVQWRQLNAEINTGHNNTPVSAPGYISRTPMRVTSQDTGHSRHGFETIARCKNNHRRSRHRNRQCLEWVPGCDADAANLAYLVVQLAMNIFMMRSSPGGVSSRSNFSRHFPYKFSHEMT